MPLVVAQAVPAWQRNEVDPARQLNPYDQWLAARRVLLTDLDCFEARGRAITLHPGQILWVEPAVLDYYGQARTPLFLGMVGWRCYVSPELSGSMDYPVPACVAAPTFAPSPADEGININMDNGEQNYLARDTFVKIGDAQAIYRVYDGQLHAFSTWPEFLNAGGEPDLSNVTHFSHLRDTTGGLFGLPVEP